MESILPPPLAWLKPFLGYAPPFDLNVDELCALGPAGFGILDAAQLFALLKGEPLDKRAAAIAIITQIAATLLWQQVCECNPPEVTPPLPTPPAAPVDLPAINPPSIV